MGLFGLGRERFDSGNDVLNYIVRNYVPLKGLEVVGEGSGGVYVLAGQKLPDGTYKEVEVKIPDINLPSVLRNNGNLGVERIFVGGESWATLHSAGLFIRAKLEVPERTI